MTRTQLALACAAAMFLAHAAQAQNEVNISLNVFPTSFANPDAGGDWTLVAKTDNVVGIGAINAILRDVNNGRIVDGDPQDDITVSGDIGAIDPIGVQPPYLDLGGGVTDLIYGQDISDPSSVVLGVGTPSQSDGPDPLGDPAWDDATIIAFGTYPSVIPGFTTAGGSVTDANVLNSTSDAMAAMPVTTVVRVAVPEPASVALIALSGLPFARDRRASNI